LEVDRSVVKMQEFFTIFSGFYMQELMDRITRTCHCTPHWLM